MDNKALILDIAMNLNRIGNWAADDYTKKRKRISTFLEETSKFIKLLNYSSLPDRFKQTYSNFINAYSKLKTEGENGPQDPLSWAEGMMTWGNILTHRSRFLN